MQLNECQTKLNDQLSMIPTSSEFTPQILDHGLKKLVETERQDLSKQYQRQLNEFNKRVMLDSLESFIRSQNLTDEQVRKRKLISLMKEFFSQMIQSSKIHLDRLCTTITYDTSTTNSDLEEDANIGNPYWSTISSTAM